MARTPGATSFVSITLAELNSKLPPEHKVKVSRRWLAAAEEAHDITFGSGAEMPEAGSDAQEAQDEEGSPPNVTVT